MKVYIDGPVVVCEDNQSAIAIAKNDRYQSRTKHIDIRYHFVRDQVENKVIQLQYNETKLQLVDFQTKSILTGKINFSWTEPTSAACRRRGVLEVGHQATVRRRADMTVTITSDTRRRARKIKSA